MARGRRRGAGVHDQEGCVNASLIVKAIKALDEACTALRSGNASISEQMQIASRCSAASIALDLELRKIEVPIEREAA